MPLVIDPNGPMEPLIADAPIQVYKIVSEDGGKIVSPYRGAEWIIGKLYQNSLTVDRSSAKFPYVRDGIQAYLGEESLTERIKRPNLRFGTPCVYLAEIPKGARYYVGRFIDFKCIASDKMRIIKRLY